MEAINIIVRPMYITDKDYIKGFQVAVYEGTTDGSWIARNTDNLNNSVALRKLKENNPGMVNIKHIPYDQIDHILAGWREDPNKKEISLNPKDYNLDLLTWDDIFEFQAKKDGANYTKLKDWLKKHFEKPNLKLV